MIILLSSRYHMNYDNYYHQHYTGATATVDHVYCDGGDEDKSTTSILMSPPQITALIIFFFIVIVNRRRRCQRTENGDVLCERLNVYQFLTILFTS